MCGKYSDAGNVMFDALVSQNDCTLKDATGRIVTGGVNQEKIDQWRQEIMPKLLQDGMFDTYRGQFGVDKTYHTSRAIGSMLRRWRRTIHT